MEGDIRTSNNTQLRADIEHEAKKTWREIEMGLGNIARDNGWTIERDDGTRSFTDRGVMFMQGVLELSEALKKGEIYEFEKMFDEYLVKD